MISYRFYSSRFLWSIDPSLIPQKKHTAVLKGIIDDLFEEWKHVLKKRLCSLTGPFFFWWGRSSVTFHFYISKCMYLWLCAWKKKWNSHKKKKRKDLAVPSFNVQILEARLQEKQKLGPCGRKTWMRDSLKLHTFACGSRLAFTHSQRFHWKHRVQNCTETESNNSNHVGRQTCKHNI